VDERTVSDGTARNPSLRFDAWEYFDNDPVREIGFAFRIVQKLSHHHFRADSKLLRVHEMLLKERREIQNQ
jgi:hypothetical protein